LTDVRNLISCANVTVLCLAIIGLSCQRASVPGGIRTLTLEVAPDTLRLEAKDIAWADLERQMKIIIAQKLDAGIEHQDIFGIPGRPSGNKARRDRRYRSCAPQIKPAENFIQRKKSDAFGARRMK
jgi:hypothetical protein